MSQLIAGKKTQVELSIVVPVYNEALTLKAFDARLTAVLADLDVSFEVIFVDDGSTDQTWSILSDMRRNGVELVKFSRNFGKEAALTAGLDVASGRAIVVIDADLQHPPETIKALLAEWRRGAQVVCAARRDRRENGPIRRRLSTSFYSAFNRLSDQPIPDGVSDFRLLDRRVVEVIRVMSEKSRFMKAMLTWPGFKLVTVPFDVAPRVGGSSKFSPVKLWRFGLDGLVNYSSKPLQIWMYVGLMAICMAGGLLAFEIASYLATGASVSGYRTVVAVVIGLSGVQIVGIGVLGEYLARVFIEVKSRPLYVVAEATKGPALDSSRSLVRPELATYPSAISLVGKRQPSDPLPELIHPSA